MSRMILSNTVCDADMGFSEEATIIIKLFSLGCRNAPGRMSDE